jgi:hypothetical protein
MIVQLRVFVEGGEAMAQKKKAGKKAKPKKQMGPVVTGKKCKK